MVCACQKGDLAEEEDGEGEINFLLKRKKSTHRKKRKAEGAGKPRKLGRAILGLYQVLNIICMDSSRLDVSVRMPNHMAVH